MRFCKQPLSVLVSSRLVDLRSMSSISVELKRNIRPLNQVWFTFTVHQRTLRNINRLDLFITKGTSMLIRPKEKDLRPDECIRNNLLSIQTHLKTRITWPFIYMGHERSTINWKQIVYSAGCLVTDCSSNCLPPVYVGIKCRI